VIVFIGIIRLTDLFFGLHNLLFLLRLFRTETFDSENKLPVSDKNHAFRFGNFDFLDTLRLLTLFKTK
jgi:hypothetical protein